MSYLLEGARVHTADVGDFGAVPTLLGGVLIGVEGCFFACLEFSDFFFPKFVLDDCLSLF